MRSGSDDRAELSAEADLNDRVGKVYRGDGVDLVGFVRDVGLPDCWILSRGLEASVCTLSSDSVAVNDLVGPAEDFERADRVEVLVGIRGEESPETRERLDGRPLLPSLRLRLLSEEAGAEATANRTPDAS